MLVLLAAGFVSGILSWQKRRLLNKQTGLGSVGELSWQQFEALVGEVFRGRGCRVLENPVAHSHEYMACCQPFIERQLEIVKPKCLVSFGNLGCWNVASILKAHNPDCRALVLLSRTISPLKRWKTLSSRDRQELHHLKLGSRELAFFPHYQPAWAAALKNKIDYGPLRKCLQVERPSQGVS